MRFNRLFQQFERITDAIKAFPLTTFFLIVLFVVNIIEIHTDITHYEKWLATLAVAIFATSVADLFAKRVITYSIAMIFTALFWFLLSSNDSILFIQTGVVLCALMMGFIWRGNENFSARFFAIFKSVLITAFFSVVIFVGLLLIYAAIDYLLFTLNSYVMEYILATVFGLFTPLFFLSLTMKDEEQSHILEVLLSTIIVPLTMVYAVILVLYIALHFTEWSENLLEPLLVSFATTVLIVYFLTYLIDNTLTKYFRLIFPKVLIVIVLYQLVVSIMKISEAGITHGRYFVILFGVFAIMIALIITFLPKKQWLVAPIFIGFSLLSITPPIDAFTISKNNQANLLQERLQSLNMFDGEIQPNSDISIEDQYFITEKFDYLNHMDYDIPWLPNKSFTQLFGFSPQYDSYVNETYYNTQLKWNEPIIYPIESYDYFVPISVSPNPQNNRFELSNDTQLLLQNDRLRLVKQNTELLAWSLKQLDPLFTESYRELSLEEATLNIENDRAMLQIVVQSANLYEDELHAELYVFVQLKE